MPKQSELMHYRLQAMLREHTFRDLEYLGVRPDSIGVEQHWYRIGEVEVPVDAIEELGNMEEVARDLPPYLKKSYLRFVK